MADPKITTQSRMIRDLQKCQLLVAQITDSLKNQKAILKQRGMNLPPMVLSSLDSIHTDLANLADRFVDEQSELRQLRALADMSAQINTELDVDTVLQRTMDVVITLTRAERGYLILLNKETRQLVFRIMREEVLVGQTPPGATPEVSTSIIRDVITSREPLLADNAYQDDRLKGNNSIANLSLRSVLCVPLLYRDDILGVVYVDNRMQSGLFTQRELNTLMAFANTAAVAISNARLFERIQTLLQEITRMKDLMDSVFASIASGIIATNPDDLITTLNRAAAHILELQPEDHIGQPLSTVLPRITADIDQALAASREGGLGQQIDGEIETARAGRRALNIKLSPLRDAQNMTQGVAVVLDDVTEIREQEQQIRITKTYLPPQMVDNIHEISAISLGGERRDVTCLFVEARAFNTLKDVRPRDLLAILNQYLGVATDCIHEVGGIVDKYMGNEIMALFNTRLNPLEDHAARALACALNMRDAFLKLYAQEGIDPQPHFYRIGIHSGVATLGNVGSPSRRDFTAIGDTINTAKRLEENAVMGQIIVSDATRERLSSDNGWQFMELGTIQVKGRQQGIPTFELSR
ncbi:GAF domain-containing protein [Phototrophicus methaneseepsis]|uniref:GAF domain-containing protein n=1 Tax=Phototrophicus methaneseepsis TaxID=2710758 RepID=A0A7S8ECK9_9CHLR|nr:adenylate/guanylate cyclase domain-containing protein [Phototrophicus methaneseepsis]QPC84500.1 GAF domain-containing protein [Phototrophicus methaneseepsis]